jgi:hypothetical protein
MKISFALVIATTLVFLQMPARAAAIHPTQRGCRVYDDTSFIGIPGRVWNDPALLPAQTVRAIFGDSIISLLPKLLLPIAKAM